VVLPRIAIGYDAFETKDQLHFEVRDVIAPLYFSSKYGLIEDWDVSKITDMRGIFEEMDTFNGDVSDWNVGKVTTMHKMFFKAKAFNQDLGYWNVENVVDMNSMFSLATKFEGYVSNWNVGSVTDMAWLFASNHFANHDVSTWNVDKVVDAQSMFGENYQFNQNLCCWGPKLIASNANVASMFRGTKCPGMPGTHTPVNSVGVYQSMCQECTGQLDCNSPPQLPPPPRTDLVKDWWIAPLEFDQTDDKLTVKSSNRGSSGVLVWKVYRSNVAVSDTTDITSTCFSNGGEEYVGSGLSLGTETVANGITGGMSSLDLSIAKGIENEVKVHSKTSSEVFFCVFLGLEGAPNPDDTQNFFSFEELAFKVTMNFIGGFTVAAVPVSAKEVVTKDAQTDYGVVATVGACGQASADAADEYNQGTAVPICVCPDETFTTVSSFTTLKFKAGLIFFDAVASDGIAATSNELAENIDVGGLSCRQIDSLLPQVFYTADTVGVIASGTVELDISGQRRTAEVNLRSLQNVEEKEFGAEFKLAPATDEVESSAMSCYGTIAGMTSVLLAAAMI